jgi:acetoin:2,6-dichlorophenolindophenol oxidoreductase subunit alpha
MTATTHPIDTHLARSLYRAMLTIRKFEERAVELFAKSLITGSTHPCIGQEAIAVGVCAALQPSDLVLATYRGHGVAIAKGADLRKIMAELLTRDTGCCKGRGGSMHICDVETGLLGTNAIVAAHIPISGGVALACKFRNSGQVTACFFGDGAACEGEFFETMNMAALWKLPLLLICENNGWAISVPVSQSQATPDIADRARGFGMRSLVVDGNDVLAVRSAVLDAAGAAREGEGPCLIECKTVRWERHSAFSSGKYANPEEARKWKTVDPIPRFATKLAESELDAGALAAEDAAATAAVQDAVDFALASPFPAPESVYDGIFAAPDRAIGISGPRTPRDSGPSVPF